MIKSIKIETNDGDYSISSIIDNDKYIMTSFQRESPDWGLDFIWDVPEWLINTLYPILLNEKELESLLLSLQDNCDIVDMDIFIANRFNIKEIFDEAFKLGML
jgi:hypothetical protein